MVRIEIPYKNISKVGNQNKKFKFSIEKAFGHIFYHLVKFKGSECIQYKPVEQTLPFFISYVYWPQLNPYIVTSMAYVLEGSVYFPIWQVFGNNASAQNFEPIVNTRRKW